MLSRDFEDEVWSRFAFELVIWPDRLLWKDELNPRVRCAFGNVSFWKFISPQFFSFRPNNTINLYTFDPTSDPTSEPTSNPTSDLTSNPTSNPTSNVRCSNSVLYVFGAYFSAGLFLVWRAQIFISSWKIPVFRHCLSFHLFLFLFQLHQHLDSTTNS